MKSDIFELQLYRQWFDVVQDTQPRYLRKEDYEAARRIYEELNMRVPTSIMVECKSAS